jgi:hypothetical protein
VRSYFPTSAPHLEDRRKELIQMLMGDKFGRECELTEIESSSLGTSATPQAAVRPHEAVRTEEGNPARVEDIVDVTVVTAPVSKETVTTVRGRDLSRVPTELVALGTEADTFEEPSLEHEGHNSAMDSLPKLVDLMGTSKEASICTGSTSRKSGDNVSIQPRIETPPQLEVMPPDALSRGASDQSKDVPYGPNSLKPCNAHFGNSSLELNGPESRNLEEHLATDSWLADGLNRLSDRILSLHTAEDLSIIALNEAVSMLSTLVDFTCDYSAERSVIKHWVNVPQVVCNRVRWARELHVQRVKEGLCDKTSPNVLIIGVLDAYVQVVLHILKKVSAKKTTTEDRLFVNVAEWVKPAVKILSCIQAAGQNLDDCWSSLLSGMFDLVFTEVLISCPLHAPWHGIFNEIRRQYDRDVCCSIRDKYEDHTLRHSKFAQSDVSRAPDLDSTLFSEPRVERMDGNASNAKTFGKAYIVPQNRPGAEGRVRTLPVIASEFQNPSIGVRRQQPEHTLRLQSKVCKRKSKPPTAVSRAPIFDRSVSRSLTGTDVRDGVEVPRKSPRRRKPTYKLAAMSIVATATQSSRADSPPAAANTIFNGARGHLDGRENSTAVHTARIFAEEAPQ